MAITLAGTPGTNTRTGTSDPWTFSYTILGTPRGFFVGISHGVSTTDHVVTVTVGGISLTEVVRRTDTATELGAAELWFVGTGVSGLSGAQTVSIDLASATTDDLLGVVWEMGSSLGYNLAVEDSDGIAENAANPTVLMSKAGKSGFSVCQMYGGGAAPGGTLATGCTLGPTVDHTAFYSQSCHETTINTTDFTIGWSTLATDDLAFVAACAVEIIPTVPNPVPKRCPGDRFLTRR